MSESLPVVYLARHGETAWSLSGQHTGLTDLPLTERGERNARSLEERLRGLPFAKVFNSPLVRAARTCELAGFGGVAEVDRDLLERNYGDTRAAARVNSRPLAAARRLQGGLLRAPRQDPRRHRRPAQRLLLRLVRAGRQQPVAGPRHIPRQDGHLAGPASDIQYEVFGPDLW